MQVTETQSDGLKRAFKVIVPASELDTRLVERLNSLQGEVRLKGFRPGKVPVAHLRRMFGKSAMAEIVQGMLGEVAKQTLDERGERAATPPDYALPEDTTETEQVLTGKADLAYTMSYEVLPKVTIGNFKTIAIERPVAPPGDEEIEARIRQIAESAAVYEPKDGPAEKGDRVTISYVGKIDGEAFQGGSDENGVLVIGSGRFIPGFEEQLEGVTAGDEKPVTVTFPENYSAKNLAGREATFDIVVKEVAASQPIVIDDALAERLGVASLEELRDLLRKQIESENATASRQKVKRQVLDKLDEMHAFELPPKMVEQEFDIIWRQITSEMTNQARTFADENTTEEAAREDYRKIAERRVRLGLVLSEIGEQQKIEVTEQEQERAMAAQLRQFPGREQALIEYFKSNPDAVAGLRAPIFEEKVIDYILELAKVTDKVVTREELLREDEE
jgi:trigger factor